MIKQRSRFARRELIDLRNSLRKMQQRHERKADESDRHDVEVGMSVGLDVAAGMIDKLLGYDGGGDDD